MRQYYADRGPTIDETNTAKTQLTRGVHSSTMRYPADVP